MAFVFSQKGLKLVADSGLSTLNGAGGLIGLFTNDETPTEASVIDDFDEPTAGWYDRQELSVWPASVYGGGKASSTNDAFPFVDAGGGGSDAEIYGYFIVDGDGDLIGAELDPDGPVTLDRAGASYTVTPTITLDNA